MKQLLLFISAITFSCSAFAQNEYTIKLNAKEDTAIQNRSFYFDNVVDEREKGQGKKVVGHFGRNDKTAAVIETDLETFFLDYLKKAYPQPKTAAVALTLLVGTPALTFIGLIGAALSVSLRRGGLLLAVLVLPLTVPVLIFGVGTASAAIVGPASPWPPLLMLSALSLASIVLATFVIAASTAGSSVFCSSEGSPVFSRPDAAFGFAAKSASCSG